MRLGRGSGWFCGVCLIGLALAGPALAQTDAAAAAGAGHSTIGMAGDYTVGDLAGRCAEAEPDFCYGFIIGGGQLYQRLRSAGVLHRWACAGKLPSLDEVRQVFLAWADGHPQMASEDAVDGFWQAMSERWPCTAE